MSDQFDKKIDFSVQFTGVKNWTFVYDTHHLCLKTDEVTKLLVKIDLKLAALGLQRATQDDKATARSAVAFMMKNKQHFSILQFMNCLKMGGTTFSELMMRCHESAMTSLIDKVQEIDSEINSKRVELENQRKSLAQEQVKYAANTSSYPPSASQTPFSGTSSPTTGASPATNNIFSSDFIEQDTVIHTTNIPEFRKQQNTSSSSESNQLDQIWGALNILAKNSTTPRPTVPTYVHKSVSLTRMPPVFNRAVHGSYRSYGQTSFAQWAETQDLSQKHSTIFFCHAFEKKIHKDYVYRISRDSNGHPVYDKVEQLVDVIIRDLQISEESLRVLENEFRNFKVSVKRTLDEEFMRCHDLRIQAYPNENEYTLIQNTKHQFIFGLDMDNLMHNTLATRSQLNLWINSVNFFSISTQLREIQHSFQRNRQNKKGYQTSNDRTNPHTKTQESMEIDNVEQFDRFKEYLNNIGSSRGRGKSTGKSSGKKVASRECRVPSCKKTFKPRLPYFSCCTTACSKKWKEIKEANPDAANNATNAEPENEEHNNFEHQDENNSAEEVSKQKYILQGQAHITPTHVYKPLCNIPEIVHDALFDTGASVTICTKELLVKLGLDHQIIYKEDDKPVYGADKTPMKGCIGYLELDIAIEDTLKRFTDRFIQRILVYQNLNHDLVIGRNAMRNGIRWYATWPELDIMLINPTINLIKNINAQKRDQVRVANNIKKQVESQPKTIIDWKVVEYDSDLQNFKFKAPGMIMNGKKFEKYKDIVERLTCNFMEQAEKLGDAENKDDSPLSEVITTGGFDGLLETSEISVSDTKEVKTNKGVFRVGAQLSDFMTDKFKKFVDNFKGNVFDTTELGKMEQVAHPELKKGAKANSGPPRYMPLNPYMQQEAAALVNKMVKLGVLVKSNKVANSTIFIVQKSSGKWRLICDLRKFNETLADYVVHLPSPYELINRICSFKLFSYGDIADAYFNMPLSKESLEENPIVASVSGMQTNFQYHRLPQGMKTSTSIFINALGVIYQPISDFTFNFLDDCVVGSSDDENEHFDRFVKFINTTNDAGLKLSPTKSAFFCKDLSFLNYTVSGGKWGLSEKQKTTISALNCDKLTKEKRESIAAFLQHYNRFTTGVAHAARKIRDGELAENAVKDILDSVKRKLLDAPALKSANFKDALHIYCDASDLDVSGVIYQKDKNGIFRLVTCFSKKLPKQMINKSIYCKELWCIQQICLAFRYLFIGDHKKTFHCDNRAALAAEKSRAPSLNCLFEYIKTTFTNVEFKYIETKKNPSDIFTRQLNQVTRCLLSRIKQNCHQQTTTFHQELEKKS